ncbi:MAG TPA: HAD family phosphatase [Candidatus Saccharimonadales bacterium]|nr:HAD family phosphatase [Candidatus Saccharimonadales bacterium]
MIDFEVKGAIFDVDDTLLDNKPGVPGQGLHERSRLAAAHTVGKEHGIPALEELTAQQNLDAFLSAPVHTLEAAVWNILVMTGVADSEAINPDNPVFQQIVALKNELHKDILREFGTEVPGAVNFVRALGQGSLRNRLAIASAAVRQDVDIFLGMTGLDAIFPDERIKTKESITHPKPNPEVFNLAFASLGLGEEDKRNVCAFEDDPRGIMAAKAAGLYVCAITTRFDRKSLSELEVAPDLIADSYQEFAGYFSLSI